MFHHKVPLPSIWNQGWPNAQTLLRNGGWICYIPLLYDHCLQLLPHLMNLGTAKYCQIRSSTQYLKFKKKQKTLHLLPRRMGLWWVLSVLTTGTEECWRRRNRGKWFLPNLPTQTSSLRSLKTMVLTWVSCSMKNPDQDWMKKSRESTILSFYNRGNAWPPFIAFDPHSGDSITSIFTCSCPIRRPAHPHQLISIQCTHCSSASHHIQTHLTPTPQSSAFAICGFSSEYIHPAASRSHARLKK